MPILYSLYTATKHFTTGGHSNQCVHTDFHQVSATNSPSDLQASHRTSLGLSFHTYKMGEHNLARPSHSRSCHSGSGAQNYENQFLPQSQGLPDSPPAPTLATPITVSAGVGGSGQFSDGKGRGLRAHLCYRS